MQQSCNVSIVQVHLVQVCQTVNLPAVTEAPDSFHFIFYGLGHVPRVLRKPLGFVVVWYFTYQSGCHATFYMRQH